mgnify:CR=1 FL=1
MGNRLKSRKFWVAVITPLVIIFTRVVGLELDNNAIVSISGVVSAYILGEAYVDSRRN